MKAKSPASQLCNTSKDVCILGILFCQMDGALRPGGNDLKERLFVGF